MLYIVSTPIGNLKDITLRAIETLKNVTLIAAEDTRHTKILLDHYGITTPTTSYFEHNEDKKTGHLVSLLKEGRDIALVTDAGTPGISDPGYPLINAAITEGIAVTVIPGPTALIAALNLSGLPAHNFIFEGFAPVKSGARRKKLEELKDLKRTVIFYESPHRLVKLLKDIEDVLDNPPVVCAREITKKFEEVKKGTAHEVLEHFSSHEPRGEFVVLIQLK
jgi:16S rRNA (cytidine1402-2'-O)-methyltransferase